MRQLNIDWIFDDILLIILDAVLVLCLWLLEITPIFQIYILKLLSFRYIYSNPCMSGTQHLTAEASLISGKTGLFNKWSQKKMILGKNKIEFLP